MDRRLWLITQKLFLALKIRSFGSNIRSYSHVGAWESNFKGAQEKKTEEPLGGAIWDLNVQYWYQNDQWMILQRLVGVSKQYRKYFRFSAKNRFLIFHPDLKSHLRLTIVRISWKFGQRCKISQIIIIYEKKFWRAQLKLKKSNHKLAQKAKNYVLRRRKIKKKIP